MSQFLENIDRVVVINDSTVARGGASALALLNANMLCELGLPVTYFAGDQGDSDDLFSSKKIDFVCVGGRSLMKISKADALTRGLFNLDAFKLMRAWIRKHDTPRTVYHLHGWQQILSPAIFLALKEVRGRTLLHAHDYFLVCPNGGLMNYATNSSCALRPMSARCVTTNCDKRNFGHKIWRVGRQGIKNTFIDLSRFNVKVALIQRGMADAFTRCGVPEENLLDIPNPCVPFSEKRVQAELNREFQFIGRLVVEKGIEKFLAAARAAGVPVRVIGDGPLKDFLIEKYPEFIFEGWCSREKLAQITQSARMLVMPSLYPEPFGLVVPEAVSSGIPVILSNSALLASDVIHHRIGVTIDPREEIEFARLLEFYALEDSAVKEMSYRGFKETNGISMTPNDWILKILDSYSHLSGMPEVPSL